MNKKEKKYTNKEIVKELQTLNKKFDEKVKVKTPTKIMSILISVMIVSGILLFITGVGAFNDWDWKITSGTIIFVLGIWVAIMREQ